MGVGPRKFCQNVGASVAALVDDPLDAGFVSAKISLLEFPCRGGDDDENLFALESLATRLWNRLHKKDRGALETSDCKAIEYIRSRPATAEEALSVNVQQTLSIVQGVKVE